MYHKGLKFLYLEGIEGGLATFKVPFFVRFEMRNSIGNYAKRILTQHKNLSL